MNIFMKMIMLIMHFFLSGCLYPQSGKMKNQLPYKDQMTMVQSAVDQFQEG